MPWASRAGLFRIDAALAAGRARRRDHRHALRSDPWWGLRHLGIDAGRRVNDAARTVEVVAQLLGRAAARRWVFWLGLRRRRPRGRFFVPPRPRKAFGLAGYRP